MIEKVEYNYDVATIPADGEVTIRQISRATRMRLAARDWMKDDQGGLLQFRIGSGSTNRMVAIRLQPSDTYRIDVCVMRKLVLYVRASVEGVYADDLSETLERLYVESVEGRD
jgi:hypothetical protein